MIGTRIFQLLVNTIIIVLCIIFLFSQFGYYYYADIFEALPLLICILCFSASATLNWNLLRIEKIHIKLPKTSLFQLLLALSGPFIIFFASKLRFYYEHHLSEYELSLDFFGPYGIGITRTEPQVYLFLFYLLVLPILSTMYILGLFSHNESVNRIRISRALLFCQISMITIFTIVVLLNAYQFIKSVLGFFDELAIDHAILNPWNLSILFFNFINEILLLSYVAWLILDSNRLWKSRANCSASIRNS
jgi:hypothetical protein